jgi:rare lipoprotein A
MQISCIFATLFKIHPMKMDIRHLAFAATVLLSLSSCARKITETGKGSFYADKFEGRPTASGEKFDQDKMTAAHRTLPFGTKVKVTNQANGRSVTVTVNDRGPFAAGRIIDVSKKAAKKLGMVNAGVANVKISYKRKKK